MKRLLRTLILLLVRILGIPLIYLAARKARKRPMEGPRILLIRPDHLGDLVLTTPILQALKEHAPDVHITMMVGPWSRDVVARHPAINQLITCPFPGFQRAAQKALAPYTLLVSTARQLHRDNYDLAINLRPDFWWGAALIYLAGIPQRIGYAIQPGTPFLTQALPFSPTQSEHATVSNLRLASAALEALHRAPLAEPYMPARYPLHFVPTAEERQWVTERLRTAGISEETPIALIHPGTGAAVKLWRIEAWITCANQLATGQVTPMPLHTVLTGSRSERPMLEEIARGVSPAPLLVGDTTVGQLAALLERASLVLGVDNGPLHLAVARHTPTVQIFGPTDTQIFGPWGNAEQHIVIAATQRCPSCPMIPCGRLDFTPEELDAHPCVRLVSEQRMLAAIATCTDAINARRSVGT
jgi:ADP-heptose:LPS heptosyltransferase